MRQRRVLPTKHDFLVPCYIFVMRAQARAPFHPRPRAASQVRSVRRYRLQHGNGGQGSRVRSWPPRLLVAFNPPTSTTIFAAPSLVYCTLTARPQWRCRRPTRKSCPSPTLASTATWPTSPSCSFPTPRPAPPARARTERASIAAFPLAADSRPKAARGVHGTARRSRRR